MIKPAFTPEQTVNLRNLLDLAVKAGGMQAAEVALPIDAAIRQAAQKYEDDQVLERAKAIADARAEDQPPTKRGKP